MSVDNDSSVALKDYTWVKRGDILQSKRINLLPCIVYFSLAAEGAELVFKNELGEEHLQPFRL